MQKKWISMVVILCVLLNMLIWGAVSAAPLSVSSIKINGGSKDIYISQGMSFSLSFVTDVSADIELVGSNFDIGGETIKAVTSGDPVTYSEIRYRGGNGLLTVNHLSDSAIVASFNILLNTSEEEPVTTILEPKFSLTQSKIPVAKYGESIELKVQLNNIGKVSARNITVELENSVLDNFNVDDINIGSIYKLIQVNNVEQLGWKLTPNSKLTTNKTFTVPLNISYEINNEYKTVTLNAYIKVLAGSASSTDARLTIAGTAGIPNGIIAGEINSMQVEIINSGTDSIEKGDVIISLPEGMSLNNSNTTKSFGVIAPGESIFVNYPIEAKQSMQSGNYPLDFEIKSLNKGGSEINVKQSVYVAVKASSSNELNNIAILNVKIPAAAKVQRDFTLKFQVSNNSKNTISKLQVKAEALDGGIVNKSKNIFVLDKLAAGGIKNYEVKFFAGADLSTKSYPIKITIDSLNGSENASITSQYTSIYVEGNNSTSNGAIKETPQLMVESYNYGDKYITAGESFNLTLSLLNTSNSRKIKNIKVTLTSDEGTFIPSGSSNSFYIPSINKLVATSRNIKLVTKPDALQKTVGVYVDMTYEDEEGNAYTAKDTISIPVMLETRLRVDEVTPPYEAYVGQPVSLAVQFYNMGKNAVNNMFVSAEGNFDIQESINYFAGNVAAGKSDTYNFNIYPRETGTTEGKVIFTYEDAEGNQQRLEKEFSFQVIDMPIMEPEMPIEEPQSSLPGWLFPMLAGLVMLGTVATIFVLRKRKKKKQEQELDLDEL